MQGAQCGELQHAVEHTEQMVDGSVGFAFVQRMDAFQELAHDLCTADHQHQLAQGRHQETGHIQHRQADTQPTEHACALRGGVQLCGGHGKGHGIGQGGLHLHAGPGVEAVAGPRGKIQRHAGVLVEGFLPQVMRGGEQPLDPAE
ncbi:hypothetical protein D3C79_920190 [compost metagenome]